MSQSARGGQDDYRPSGGKQVSGEEGGSSALPVARPGLLQALACLPEPRSAHL